VLAVAQSSPKYYFFVEDGNLEANTTPISTANYVQPVRFGPLITSGQSAYVEAWWVGSYLHFYLLNVSTGSYDPFSGNTTSIGITNDSSECIGEWPASTAFFPDYNRTDFQNCQTSINGQNSLINFSSLYYNQIAQWYGGARLQYPGALDASQFELYWQSTAVGG
jgi:hypothetical protein